MLKMNVTQKNVIDDKINWMTNPKTCPLACFFWLGVVFFSLGYRSCIGTWSQLHSLLFVTQPNSVLRWNYIRYIFYSKSEKKEYQKTLLCCEKLWIYYDICSITQVPIVWPSPEHCLPFAINDYILWRTQLEKTNTLIDRTYIDYLMCTSLSECL